MINLLAKLADKTGKTRSELIREALREVYNQADVRETMKQISELESFKDLDFQNTSTRSDRSW